MLVLLDLSATFHTVDHAILEHCACLEHCVDIKGSALNWFNSYFSNQSFRVNIGEHSSEEVPLSCGVSRGSILAPILFFIIYAPIGFYFLGSIVCHSIAMQMTLKSICS